MRLDGDRRVFSVRGVVTAIGRRFQDLPSFWVEGEITNLSRARKTQVFFTLVDTDHGDPTQIDCMMQANVFTKIPVAPVDGQLVQAYGRVEFWRGRSTLRLRVERLEPSGEGLLMARIAELRARLRAEGLTAEDRKRPLPVLPRAIGLVTARDGAARADVISNVRARFPAVDIVVVSTLVQGDGAPAQIAGAVAYLDRRPDVDVIVIARGGGALEDLMAFNSELVCRAVAAATTPVVSAVGHEDDDTLCDAVADVRASTPTKAAELVVPDLRELRRRLADNERRVLAALRHAADRPAQGLAIAARRLVGGLRSAGERGRHRVDLVGARLTPALAGARADAVAGVVGREDRLHRAVAALLAQRADRLERTAAVFQVLSPQQTVRRGYAIVRDGAGRVVGHVAEAHVGERLRVELRDGTVDVDVVGRTETEAG